MICVSNLLLRDVFEELSKWVVVAFVLIELLVYSACNWDSLSSSTFFEINHLVLWIICWRKRIIMNAHVWNQGMNFRKCGAELRLDLHFHSIHQDWCLRRTNTMLTHLIHDRRCHLLWWFQSDSANLVYSWQAFEGSGQVYPITQAGGRIPHSDQYSDIQIIISISGYGSFLTLEHP